MMARMLFILGIDKNHPVFKEIEKLFPPSCFSVVRVLGSNFSFDTFYYEPNVTIKVWEDEDIERLKEPTIYSIPCSRLNYIIGLQNYIPENLLRSPLEFYEILENNKLRNMRM